MKQMKRNVIKCIFLGLLLCATQTLLAEDEKQNQTLKSLLSPVNTLNGTFKQTVKSEKGKVLQTAFGKMYIKKPGKFRWEVGGRDARIVISDGKQVFDYDKELAQVTVQKLNQGRTRAPIFFLTGNVESLDKDFNVIALGLVQGPAPASEEHAKPSTGKHAKKTVATSDAKEVASTEKHCLMGSDACFELKPKRKEGAFQWIKIGFKNKALKEMEMVDQLGQHSYFIFENVILNGKLEESLFQFKAPKGVDVLHT